jgi:hypothetical protein
MPPGDTAEGRRSRIFRPSLFGTGELVDIIDDEPGGAYVFEMCTADVSPEIRKMAIAEVIARQKNQPDEDSEDDRS